MNGKINSARQKDKLSLLVVDDEPNVCECISLVLSMDGHRVVTASNGPMALSLFEKEKFDLVFTDYSMPGMKGDQLAAAIRQIAPDQPITMITGMPPARVPSHVDSVLGKPFQISELRDAVARCPAKEK